MKLYYAPGACSLADHIALLEAGLEFDAEAIDLKAKRTQSGADYRKINPKGYVPALELDDGQILTENVALLDWIADQAPALRADGPLGRTRTLEMLAFVSTEIHHAFKPLWHGGSDEEKQEAGERVAELFRFTAGRMQGDYLFGDRLSVADCYLYVTVRWADRFDIATPAPLLALRRAMEARPSARAALAYEELSAVHDRLRQPSDVPLSAQVTENSPERRFERPIHANVIAAAYYRNTDGLVEFIHTEVPSEWSGLGIGSELARGALELLRQSGRKAMLTCPFMGRFFSLHPEYGDVVRG